MISTTRSTSERSHDGTDGHDDHRKRSGAGIELSTLRFLGTFSGSRGSVPVWTQVRCG